MDESLKNKIASCAVIIVTYNSQIYLKRCLESLQAQSLLPAQVIIVDNASETPKKFDYGKYTLYFKLVNLEKNVGFSKANNIGLTQVDNHIEYVLFLNPDTFIQNNLIEYAQNYLRKPSQFHTAAISGLLLGYNIHNDTPTGKIDSSGIFQTWYGKWYDRAQGRDCEDVSYNEDEEVPALCGALIFCRKKALDSVLLSPGEIWDSTFFMYKEDIDLSVRLYKKGWKIKFLPSLVAYHCRGWKTNRTEISRFLRLHSAKNEMKLHLRMRSLFFFYSCVKYLAVKILNF